MSHRIEPVGDQGQTGQDVQAGLQLGQLMAKAFGDDLEPEVEKVTTQVSEAGPERLADRRVGGRDQTGQVDRIRTLERRVATQVGQGQLFGAVALEFQHNADIVGGLVAYVDNLGDFTLDHQLGNLFDQLGLVDGVGQGGNHHLALAARQGFDLPLTAQLERALAGFVQLAQLSFGGQDFSPGRKVRALDRTQQAGGADVGVLQHGQQSAHHLMKIMRRDVGRHADGDAAGAVQQQLGDGCGQDDRFVNRGVVVRTVGNRVAAQIPEQLLGQGRQLGLGIAHGRSVIAVQRAEITLAMHQRVAHGEGLGQADHGVIRGLVAVGVIFAQHLADYRRGFARSGVAAQAQVLEHGVQQPPLDRFQPVAHVGQRPRGNNAQGVVQIALFGLLAQVCRENPLCHRRLFHTSSSTGEL